MLSFISPKEPRFDSEAWFDSDGKTYGRIRYGPRIFVSISIDELAFDYVAYENVDCWCFEVEEEELQQDVISGHKSHYFLVKEVEANNIVLEKSD